MGDTYGRMHILLLKKSVMNSTYPSLISETENLQYPQEILVLCLIMCTSTIEKYLHQCVETLIIKKQGT